MTPAARVQTAIELLDEIFEGAPAEKVLTAWARRSRFAGSKDRAAIRDHVYDALRRRRSAMPVDMAESGRALMIGLLRQDDADLQALFTDQPYGPEGLTSAEQTALEQPFSGKADLPAWMVPHLKASLGDGFDATVEALRHRAPVFLRVNLQKGSRDQAIEALKADGVDCGVSTLADTALLVREGPRRVAQSAAYRDGLVEVQDTSSQAAIAGLPLQGGMRVLDYCAGGGGKTLGMGARIKGQFVAHDANPGRVRDLPQRAKRAGLQFEILDTDQLKDVPEFDLVFCDVPCSGSGTWRRTPDAKWRFEVDDLTALNAVQTEILQMSISLLNQKGTLVYATCSLLREENEDQISRFLLNNPDFDCSYMQRWSMDQGCDGFFIAHLTRH